MIRSTFTRRKLVAGLLGLACCAPLAARESAGQPAVDPMSAAGWLKSGQLDLMLRNYGSAALQVRRRRRGLSGHAKHAVGDWRLGCGRWRGSGALRRSGPRHAWRVLESRRPDRRRPPRIRLPAGLHDSEWHIEGDTHCAHTHQARHGSIVSEQAVSRHPHDDRFPS